MLDNEIVKIFIGGSRKLAALDDEIKNRLDNILRKGYFVLVGDANGIDKAVQKYLSEKDYGNVVVYCTGQNCRNNLGDWKIRHIQIEQHKKHIHGFFANSDIFT